MRRDARNLRNTGYLVAAPLVGLVLAITACGGGDDNTSGVGDLAGAAATPPTVGAPSTEYAGGGIPPTAAGAEHRGNAGAGADSARSHPSGTGAAEGPPSSAGPVVSGVALGGTWHGSYVCTQGTTGLSLRVEGADPAALTATFGFYPLPENPSVPRGSFTMAGSVRGGQIYLDGHEWVSRPTGYQMVNLTGTPRAGTPDRIEGDVRDVAGCTGFSIQRATPAEN